VKSLSQLTLIPGRSNLTCTTRTSITSGDLLWEKFSQLLSAHPNPNCGLVPWDTLYRRKRNVQKSGIPNKVLRLNATETPQFWNLNGMPSETNSVTSVSQTFPYADSSHMAMVTEVCRGSFQVVSENCLTH
jgi:hypothetical protein